MPASQACKFVVAPESTIGFEAKSTLHGLHGSASPLEGTMTATMDGGVLSLDPLPSMHVEVPVERLTSGNALQDQQMWRLLDSKRNRSIYADLRGLASLGGDRYRAQGDITLTGRVRGCTGDMTIAVAEDRITVDGSLVVDIRDFGITPPRILMVTVQPQVTVNVHVVAALAAGAP